MAKKRSTKAQKKSPARTQAHASGTPASGCEPCSDPPTLKQIAAAFSVADKSARTERSLSPQKLVDLYPLGQKLDALIRAMSPNPTGRGIHPVEFVANTTEWPEDELWLVVAVSRQFSREELKSLVERTMANGRKLRSEHFRALIRIGPGMERTALINRVFAESRGAKAIWDAVKREEDESDAALEAAEELDADIQSGAV